MARQYQIPGAGYVDADGIRQYAIPGKGYINVDEGSGGPTYTLTAAAGSFTFTGRAAGLKASRKIAASKGTFTLTGVAAILKASRKMAGSTGAFTLTGVPVVLKAGRKLAIGTGTFVLTGNAADLVYTPGGAGPTYTLTASVGAFSFTGSAATLKAARKLPAGTATFTLTGNNVTLTLGGGVYQENKNLLIDSIGGKVLQLGTTRIPIWNTSGRPSSPKSGTIGFNTQTSALEIWNGSAWKSVILT